ncbi:hypothetical protein JOD54_005930 [Actinokineospora baliensis]|uniref:hypothetical protein n=1 Tax=Actinokineospora baliensis TaxID=547056 RepID=UPI001EF80867|nr:hypothetical protein [Actinokineospora baliensis]MBM7775726.1 hypothetical protein [Actinokineospora baliensis]
MVVVAGSGVVGEAEFGEITREIVRDQAPRLFAVVQELGERVDLRIAAWGMEFDDHAAVVSEDGSTRLSVRSAEHALPLFGGRAEVTPHVVWVAD